MSFQVRDTCYASASEAVGAMASSQIGAVVAIADKTYVINSSTFDASSITYVLQDVASTATITKVATVNPPPCGLLDTGDGLLIAWGIATAWLVTAGLLFLRRGLHE